MPRLGRISNVTGLVLLLVAVLFYMDWSSTKEFGDFGNPAPYGIVALLMTGSLAFHVIGARLNEKKMRTSEFSVLFPILALMFGGGQFLIFVCQLPGLLVWPVISVGYLAALFGPDWVAARRRKPTPSADAADEGSDAEP
jgi:hypothetical protein